MVLQRSFGGSETNMEGICHWKAQKDAYSAHGPELGVAGTQNRLFNLDPIRNGPNLEAYTSIPRHLPMACVRLICTASSKPTNKITMHY
ncbi:uncharacterized protein ARMOST_02665 [Armillaria ostoyae]|uniref:Uncharacterized protein n=1 Tax=Armillaria ostoyae TaxID=47428 RepID=A0A284QSB5_ARMOS|nr:uncharacterized protein ARMOST_02665 [Armillaria ostoyae]